jgi:hypothetical protein
MTAGVVIDYITNLTPGSKCNPTLREVSIEGCARLEGLRVAALGSLRSLGAKACKGLTAVWLEDSPPPPENPESPAPEAPEAPEEGGRGEGGGGGGYGEVEGGHGNRGRAGLLIAEETNTKKKGEEEEEEEEEEETVADGALRLDLRNCSSLVRLVGVRAAALEGRLFVDLTGCASLPVSARPPTGVSS